MLSSRLRGEKSAPRARSEACSWSSASTPLSRPGSTAATGEPVDLDKTFADLLEEIELADQVGLDVFGLGEHHRPDYAISAPAVALAAGAARTKRIRLTSAVTVLSSDDPVRVYQQFATLDCLSGGRAEIMAGRGAFIESFPLFGYAPRRLRDPVRRKPRTPARHPQRSPAGMARRPSPGAERPGRLSARVAKPPARLDRLGRHAAVGGARRDPRPAARHRHHRRGAGPLRPAGRALSRGGPPRGRAGKRAQARHQRPRFSRRQRRGRGRRLFRALRRGDAPAGARARLAAADPGAVRRRPLAARAI